MVNIPAGSFKMGCVSGKDCQDDEKPVHRVNVSAFQMGKTEVTFALWDKCVETGGCSHRPDDEGWGRVNRPVINVSYNDITQEFLPWLNAVTDGGYRLPSEAQWEHAARAGTSTPFSTGNCITASQANFNGNYPFEAGGCKQKGKYRKKTLAVGSFAANSFGLHDMHGNVWELTADCWNKNYHGAPTDGAVWQSGECSRRVVRGGSWSNEARYLRSANRSSSAVSDGSYGGGFRLSRSK